MNRRLVTVVDYGIGNLFSVRRAFETMGAEVVQTQDPAVLLAAERLVLPGVGAFKDGMEGLRRHGLIEPIQTYVKTGKPFLGICLGMQMMLDESEEFGNHKGLGIIPGKVVRIPDHTSTGSRMKVPHIAWDDLQVPPSRSQGWSGTLFNGVREGSSMYFVHSYAAAPTHAENLLATVNYGGMPVAAAIIKDQAFGCQFHPERSGKVGLKIIANFINL